MGLTDSQVHALETTERVASTFSLIGCSFIFVTFLASPRFGRPINRLIFYASWGNTLCNVGTLISLAGINAGQYSALCQSQGFLIQLFVLSDALWNMSMAMNVYLTVFKNYNTDDLKRLEWIYLLVNYGLPFIPAFAYCFINVGGRGKIYGPAVLWCWVTPEYDFLRVALLYGPAWICILITFALYVWAGRVIFIKRKQLRSFNNNPGPTMVENPFTSFKTTEIHVTSELACLPTPSDTELSDKLDPKSKGLSSQGYEQYSIKIERGPLAQAPPPTPGAQAAVQRHNNAAMEANTAAWGYTKCALMFFASLMITWVPSSVFRVYSLVHPGPAWWPLAYAAGLVLPLMGFWNTVIYVTTSWSAIKSFFPPSLPRPFSHRKAGFQGRRMGRPRTLRSLEEGEGRGKRPASESDSMTVLRGGR
ncbi:hypothetical protein MMC30_000317 [Trapelia coarctata]|nr:hypothetical protein [Trapelia coarctata]